MTIPVTRTPEVRAPAWVPTDETFGARLALIRQRMGWGNVKEAALACGLPVESWRTWERDNVQPRSIVAVARKIADRTGCDFGWLLDQGLRGRSDIDYKRNPAESRGPAAVRPRDNRPGGHPPQPSLRRPKVITGDRAA